MARPWFVRWLDRKAQAPRPRRRQPLFVEPLEKRILLDGGLAPDPDGIITGGHGNETGRMIAIRRGEPINRPAMLALFRAIVADNRAGGPVDPVGV